VKIRVQFTPDLTAALFCAAGWFSLWLFAFRPAPPQPATAAPHPEFIRLIADDETLDKLKTPTLFALPSAEGFSGNFLEPRINLHLTLEKPSSPVRYLPHEKAAAPGIDLALLSEKTFFPQETLPAPGSVRTTIRPAAETQLFFSPELKSRTGDTSRLGAASAGMSGTVRVTLTVRPDGTVESAFFETPVTNAFLLSAVRQLKFKPSGEKTEGWIDIRFAQEEKE
jgi:TonB family protein